MNNSIVLNKPERMLQKVQDSIGGEIRESSRNVPHLLIQHGELTFSVCYFGKSKSFRVFYPYPADQQTKIELKTYQDVIRYFMELPSELFFMA